MRQGSFTIWLQYILWNYAGLSITFEYGDYGPRRRSLENFRSPLTFEDSVSSHRVIGPKFLGVALSVPPARRTWIAYDCHGEKLMYAIVGENELHLQNSSSTSWKKRAGNNISEPQSFILGKVVWNRANFSASYALVLFVQATFGRESKLLKTTHHRPLSSIQIM